jgi:NAD+ synthase (glutamine-hydrolysing)
MIIMIFLKNNFSKEKILFLANKTFSKDLEKELNLFYKRFYQNQFKRTMVPPGVKVGSVSVSIRGDLRLPDEINLDEE